MRDDTMNKPNRITNHWIDGVLQEPVSIDLDWYTLRTMRNAALKETDYWAVKDLTMSQAKKDYRKFLRDLPTKLRSSE